VIIIESGIENQEETTLGLMPPHWVIREHDDMALPHWNIYHGRRIGQL
jgi:hypothetical protein